MEKTCCPLYTIRLDALNFKLSRSQKRILRIWNDFLRYDKRPPVKGDVRVHEHLSNQSICTKKKSATAPVPEKNRERKKKFIRKNRAIQRMKNKGIDIEQVSKQS
jgi:arginyl-tRNA--protein-N-Asp/Glu arginylyltransferase